MGAGHAKAPPVLYQGTLCPALGALLFLKPADKQKRQGRQDNPRQQPFRHCVHSSPRSQGPNPPNRPYPIRTIRNLMEHDAYRRVNWA
ncbi:hypothetical protein CCC_03116 [Paramagnetospirillum magnetotacticum MS-1]|uniref:Uncharacterized protein n=1 Tax=Paramagnetospirillum magnetotacticum MS-1 TaxID=272627 RepID=A0A0C2YZK3_PARME|nr:hypothetical protein CCC_03116 [Paramagnetospirillum magnetotacticum MS-1]